MTWRSNRLYSKSGGRGYAAAAPTPASKPAPARPVPSRPSGQPPAKATFNPMSSDSRPRPPGGPGPSRPGGTPPAAHFDPSRPPGSTPRPTPRYPKTTFTPEYPGMSFTPKTYPGTFHPPGPGIGIQPGPPPALGRPSQLPRDHGSWRDKSCFAPGSRGWKPDINSIGDAHTCPVERGPQSPFRPPNLSQREGGYNTRLFRDEESVAQALEYIGYGSTDGNAMLRDFQRHWNGVISALSLSPVLFSSINFAALPEGNLKVDGDIGPNTLNAIEAAVINQRLSNLLWTDIVQLSRTSDNGYGRRHVYNAAQGM